MRIVVNRDALETKFYMQNWDREVVKSVMFRDLFAEFIPIQFYKSLQSNPIVNWSVLYCFISHTY